MDREMPSLLMLSPAPVIEASDGEVVLDVAFVEGMKLHCQLWPGRVTCVLRRGAVAIPDGMRFSAARLDFNLVVFNRNAEVPESLLDEAGLVYVALDDMRHIDLHMEMRRRVGRLVYTVEMPLSGRLQAVLAGKSQPLVRRLRSALWNLRREQRFRAAIAGADGAHFNGPLASDAYSRLNADSLTYMDNRIRQPMLARTGDMTARAARLRAGAPLRLAWFGPLNVGSGVLDLLPVLHLLDARGIPFEAEIIGTGPAASRLRDGIAALGLGGKVHLRGPLGMETALLPRLRKGGDVLLMPRRAPEPLPAYIEGMGCGLAVLSYANPTWKRLQARSGGGWVCRGPSGMVDALARLAQAPDEVIAAQKRALDFARQTSFEMVFAARMSHLRALAGLDE
jgi:colanic acid/amylovoran biosynthesis glycosyltransferase